MFKKIILVCLFPEVLNGGYKKLARAPYYLEVVVLSDTSGSMMNVLQIQNW